MFLSQIMASENILWYVRLTENAFPLVRESPAAEGYEMRTAYVYEIPAGGVRSVRTELQVQLPARCFGKITSRSGSLLHPYIDVLDAVIKKYYRGQFCVFLVSHAETDFKVHRGERVAQFICQNTVYPIVQEATKLDETDCRTRGYGRGNGIARRNRDS
jgi:dUTP pyrophosphatase